MRPLFFIVRRDILDYYFHMKKVDLDQWMLAKTFLQEQCMKWTCPDVFAQLWAFTLKNLYFIGEKRYANELHFAIIFNFIFYFLTPKAFCIGVYPVNNIVIISGEQWRESAIHICVSILPQNSLPSRLAHNINQSSMCCTIGFHWLSILNIAMCTWSSQSP